MPCPCCPWFPCFFCWFLGACLLDEESFLDWSESSFGASDDCLESEASGEASSPAWGLGFSRSGSEPSVLKKSWTSPEEPDASVSLGCWSSTGASLVSASGASSLLSLFLVVLLAGIKSYGWGCFSEKAFRNRSTCLSRNSCDPEPRRTTSANSAFRSGAIWESMRALAWWSDNPRSNSL